MACSDKMQLCSNLWRFTVELFLILNICNFYDNAGRYHFHAATAADTCYMKYELFGNLSLHEKPVSVTLCRGASAAGGAVLPDPELWNSRTREILNSRPTRCYALWGHVHAQDVDHRAKWHTSSHSIYGCLNAEQTTALNMYTRTAEYPTEPGCYRYVSEAGGIGYLFTLCVCDTDKCNQYGEEGMKKKYGVKGTKVLGDVLKFEMTFNDDDAQEFELEQQEESSRSSKNSASASNDAADVAVKPPVGSSSSSSSSGGSIKCKIKSMLGVGNQLDNSNWSEFACPPSTKYCVVRQGVAQAFDHSTIFDWRSNDTLPVSTRHCATPMRLARLKQLYNIAFDTYPDNGCIVVNSTGPTTHFEGALCTCSTDGCNVNDTEFGIKLLNRFQASTAEPHKSGASSIMMFRRTATTFSGKLACLFSTVHITTATTAAAATLFSIAGRQIFYHL